MVLVDYFIAWQRLTIFKVGISPSRSAISTENPDKQNLKTRFRHHLRGYVYGSTLRLSLGCLMSESLGIRLLLAIINFPDIQQIPASFKTNITFFLLRPAKIIDILSETEFIHGATNIYCSCKDIR